MGLQSLPYVLSSRVPQGSNLGPLLFLVDINDIVDILNNGNCKISLYADDVKLYIRVRQWDDADAIQQTLNEFVDWCYNNKLSLNINKCKIISYRAIPDSIIKYT